MITLPNLDRTALEKNLEFIKTRHAEAIAHIRKGQENEINRWAETASDYEHEIKEIRRQLEWLDQLEAWHTAQHIAEKVQIAAEAKTFGGR